jgi:Subtilase family
VEEQNWAAAAERGDSLGIDVFSISLGYTTYDNNGLSYTYNDMTGNKTMITRAVNLAAKKGMLVAAAAGNDGNNSWRYIATPGDADSALTVGAVNTIRQSASFSSYGPNFDGQIKPDVAAVGAGVVVASTGSGLPSFSNGTSYACPIMAGVSTCLWQAFPEVNNMEIIQGLRQSGDRFTTPDDRTGYGIPDVKRAFVHFIGQLRTLNSYMDECTAVFNYTVKASSEMNLVFERKLPSDADYIIIDTQTFTGAFATRTFSYSDGLGEYTSGVPIKYRIKMAIGTDTSFYLDSVSLAYVVQCNQITERKICPNTSTYLSADSISGYTAKWQVDTGNGYTDIVNNAIYSGANTRVLLLNNIPANFYSYTYRSVQTNGSNTINSTPIELKFINTWTGAVSNAWEDAGNWSCGVIPNQYTDAVISSQSPTFPLVSSNASCHSLISSPGASVTIKTGFNLQVTGQ